MSGAEIIASEKDAALWVKVTKGGTVLPTEADRQFLSLLSQGACRLNFPRVTSKVRDQVRKRCKHQGWAQFVDDKWSRGWRLTEFGRLALMVLPSEPTP